MALQNKALHRSHILSIVWLCFNKLKMNVSCLSKAQRLCAEFVENLDVLSRKLLFVHMRCLVDAHRGWDVLTCADPGGHVVDRQERTACPGDADEC